MRCSRSILHRFAARGRSDGPHPNPLPRGEGTMALTLTLSHGRGSDGPHPNPLPRGEGAMALTPTLSREAREWAGGAYAFSPSARYNSPKSNRSSSICTKRLSFCTWRKRVLPKNRSMISTVLSVS